MFPFNYLLLLLFTIATSFVVGFATASYSVPIVIMAVGLTAVVAVLALPHGLEKMLTSQKPRNPDKFKVTRK